MGVGVIKLSNPKGSCVHWNLRTTDNREIDRWLMIDR